MSPYLENGKLKKKNSFPPIVKELYKHYCAYPVFVWKNKAILRLVSYPLCRILFPRERQVARKLQSVTLTVLLCCFVFVVVTKWQTTFPHNSHASTMFCSAEVRTEPEEGAEKFLVSRCNRVRGQFLILTAWNLKSSASILAAFGLVTN